MSASPEVDAALVALNDEVRALEVTVGARGLRAFASVPLPGGGSKLAWAKLDGEWGFTVVEPNGEWRPLARVSPRRRLEAVALLHVLVAEAEKRDDERRRPVTVEEVEAGTATLRALRGES